MTVYILTVDGTTHEHGGGMPFTSLAQKNYQSVQKAFLTMERARAWAEKNNVYCHSIMPIEVEEMGYHSLL